MAIGRTKFPTKPDKPDQKKAPRKKASGATQTLPGGLVVKDKSGGKTQGPKNQDIAHEPLLEIAQAIKNHKKVSFLYKGAQRALQPMGFKQTKNGLMVIGVCQQSMQIRMFSVATMVAVREVEE